MSERNLTKWWYFHTRASLRFEPNSTLQTLVGAFGRDTQKRLDKKDYLDLATVVGVYAITGSGLLALDLILDTLDMIEDLQKEKK